MIRVVKTDRKDQFNRRIYVDEKNRQFVDINLNDHNPSIHATYRNGEPSFPVDCVISPDITSLEETKYLKDVLCWKKEIKADKMIFRGHMWDSEQFYLLLSKQSDNWVRLHTQQDAPYFALYINEKEETTVTYCEGDVIIVVPSDFEKELKETKEFYNIEDEEDKRICFKDSTGNSVQLSEMFSHIINK